MVVREVRNFEWHWLLKFNCNFYGFGESFTVLNHIMSDTF